MSTGPSNPSTPPKNLPAVLQQPVKAELAVARKPTSLTPAQWDLAWEEFGLRYPRLKHGPAIITFVLFTFLGQSVLGILSFIYGFLPWSPFLLVFLCTMVLWQMFVMNFSGKAYSRKLAALAERTRPNLFMDYRPSDGAPFVHREQEIVQYRVSVQSPVPVADAELVVNGLRVGAGLHDLHLRPMHDRQPQGTKRVNLQPFKEKYWDVVSEFSRPGGNAVVLNSLVPHGGLPLAVGKYEFELMVSGGQNPPTRKGAIVEVSEDIKVRFEVFELTSTPDF